MVPPRGVACLSLVVGLAGCSGSAKPATHSVDAGPHEPVVQDAGAGPDGCCKALGSIAYVYCGEANGGVGHPCDPETQACEISCDDPGNTNGPGVCAAMCIPLSDVCGGTPAECTSGPYAKGLCCGVVTFYENQ